MNDQMKTETMIDRVARAIYETEPYAISMRDEMPWTDVDESQKEGCRVKAVAAIEAMRNPTEEMQRALTKWATCAGYVGEGWIAAIDAALGKETTHHM
ncbi:hypothetical protein [Rhizobium sp. Root1220]|uniref:hypothetical protein n=1 Tax=Rhizobium sp. Root1220 TaxID=1736432 RepID=UPI0006FBC5B4|nr:hypothetical protein [Rhizobium sp. Root1220]KQV78171.1 hypothetical protein ASC90_26975 [Rhizobium sp. Root1220]